MKYTLSLLAATLLATPVLAADQVALPSLGTDFATELAQSAVAACAADGYQVTAAVTDRSGVLLALAIRSLRL